MRTVVLVHGAWHGPWCWAAVLAGLDELGVPAVPVDLPGPGVHADGDHVRGVVDAVGGPVVLVGHSYGGAVITDAGTHPAVEHLVYLAALVPDKGETVPAIDVEGGETSAIPAALVVDGDLVTLDPAQAPAVLYGDCSPADTARAVSLLRPQGLASFREGPRSIAWRERPVTYVVCGEDRALPAAYQLGMAARIPGAAVVEWPTASHSPFLSMPGEVVDVLAGLAS
jgi:pimeloyl-ACP methyl ester carboxylesterase